MSAGEAMAGGPTTTVKPTPSPALPPRTQDVATETAEARALKTIVENEGRRGGRL